MTPRELKSIGERVFGHGWQTRIAEHVRVSDRTVRHWVAGTYPVPPGAAAEIRALVEIPSPQDQEALRDEACHDALEPHLHELSAKFVARGWHPAEVLAAYLSITIEGMRSAAGIPATIKTLREAVAELKAARDD